MNENKQEELFWRWVPVIVWVISVLALVGGGYSVINEEFCSKSRGGNWSCSYGVRAQIHGATVMLIGLILAMLPLKESKKKSVGIWIVVALLVPSVFASILYR